MISSRPDFSRIGFRVVESNGNLWIVVRLLVVEHVLNPIPSSNFCFNEIFGGGRGDMYTFSYKNFSFFRNTISWKCFLKKRWRSIEFDKTSIFSSNQDRYRSNKRRFGVFSMHCANIVHDVIHTSRSRQGLCDFCPQNQQVRWILSARILT